MTRDYAKNKTKKKKYNKKTSRISIIVALLTLVAIISLLAPTKYQPRFFYSAKQTFINVFENKISKIKKQKKSTKHKSITKTATSPHFDFYNILPEKKNVVTQQDYELAISKTKDFAVADRLKAKLTLLGFTTNIIPIYEKGIQQYYVNIGPYKDKESAYTDQKRLKKNNIHSVPKKINVIN